MNKKEHEPKTAQIKKGTIQIEDEPKRTEKFYLTKMSTSLKFESHQRTTVQCKKAGVLSLNSWGC